MSKAIKTFMRKNQFYVVIILEGSRLAAPSNPTLLKIAIIKGIDPICVKMNIMKIPNAYLHMLFFTLSAFCMNIFYYLWMMEWNLLLVFMLEIIY